MRTDSTRVSEQAIADVRALHRREVRARLRAGEAERLQDEGGRAGRARSDPSDVHAVRARRGACAPHAGSVLPLSADLEPLRRLADAAGHLRRHDGRHQGRPFDRLRAGLHVPGEGLGPEVRRLARRLQPGNAGDAVRPRPRCGIVRGRRGRRRAAGAPRGGYAQSQGAEARAEVHPAAAALQRGDPRQGARGERHRPAEHVRLDHQRHPGARLREQDRRTVQADHARPDSRRAAQYATGRSAC